MKKQMTQIGIGIAALSALAVEGKDFNRAELNAMLDRLAASPEPKVRRGPQATCYSVAVPQPERFEYVCKNCGMHTVYPRNNRRMANTLSRYRDDAASLRALGLDIALDESVLCQKCNPFTQECWINAVHAGVLDQRKVHFGNRRTSGGQREHQIGAEVRFTGAAYNQQI